MPETLSSLIRPEQGPVLPTFERLAPPPPLNLVAAEIEARSRAGDVVVDLFGRGAWVARTSIGRLRRSYTYESSALTRLLAEVVLRPPDVRHFDAAVASLASSPRGEASLRQSLNDMFASRCPTCHRAATVDEFIWEADGKAPLRKSYRCQTCRDQVGGGEQRSAATDEQDAERAVAADVDGPAYDGLAGRFPVVDGMESVPAQLLGLYTPRTLIAIQAILQRLDTDLRAAPIEAALRLALLHVLLPASRLNSYPGRLGSLRISAGKVRMPASRQWRERNPWLLFEDGCRLVRGFVQRLEALPGGHVQARLGEDLLDLADATANVVLRGGLPRGRDRGMADEIDRRDPRVRLVLTQPPVRWTSESLSFAYHATSLLLGPDAASTLPLEMLAGPAQRLGWGWEASSIERALRSVAPILSRDARAVIMLEPGGPEGLVAGALGGVGAGYRLSNALLAESDEAVGGTLEFLTPGAPRPEDPRTRAGLALPSLEPRGADARPGGLRLEAVEREVTEIAVAVLQARGEPARFERLLGEILVGLDRAGHLARLVGTRTYEHTSARSERTAEALGLMGEAGITDEDVASIRRAREAAAETEPRDAADAESPPLRDETAAAGDDRADAEARARAATGWGELGHDLEARSGPDAASPASPSGGGEHGRILAPADSPVAKPGADHVGMLLELINGELRRSDNPRLEELEGGRWWLRDRRDLDGVALPLSDRLEWAVFSLLSATGGLSEAALYDRVAGMFRGYDMPDQSLVQACVDSYRSRASTADLILTADELQSRYREHTELIGLLVEYGHRLGLRCWVNPHEQKRMFGGQRLATLLSETEQRTYLPLHSRGSIEALEAVDCLWYLRNKASLIFEVEWTAMLADPVLRRGAAIPQDENTVRFLVVLPERVELIKFKLERSPLLREALDRDNWHFLKANHLRALAAEEEASLDRFAPYLGLDPEIERQGGDQLPMFGGAQASADGSRGEDASDRAGTDPDDADVPGPRAESRAD